MTAFTPIGFYDLSGFYASYLAKHRRALVDSSDPRHTGVRFLDLIRSGEPAPVLEDWKQAASLLHKVETRLRDLEKPATIENAYICAFDPEACEAWSTAPDPFGMEIHLLLAPAPGFRLLCASETAVPAPWVALAVNPAKPRSRTNFDAPNTAHELVLEITFDADPGVGTDSPVA